MELFAQQLVNGLALGAIYALIAVGYTMVYGVLRLINFAHGDVYMLGAMMGVYGAYWFGLGGGPAPSAWTQWGHFLLLLFFAMAVCSIVGFLIEFLAYRPLRNQPRLTVLITAIGVSMFLEFGGQQIFGANPQAFPAEILPPVLPGSMDAPVEFAIWSSHLLSFQGSAVNIGGVRVDGMLKGGVIISAVDLVILVMTFLLMAVLTLVIKYTQAGRALRAVSFRFDTAALMGINVNRIISFTFVLGSALAAAAGILIAVRAPKVDPLMGLLPGLKAFVAAVLGGIGNIPGAVAGAFLLGLTETFVAGYIPQGSQYRDGVAFVILIGVLLIKPSGLLGQNVVEKV